MVTQLQSIAPVFEGANPCLSSRDLLHIWELGQGQGPIDRALTILALAYPHEEADRLSIGERDNRLFAVREATFGTRLDCLAACLTCGETIELTLESTDLRAGITQSSPLGAHSVDIDGWQIRFRLPDSRDLADALEAGDLAASQRRLMERCVTSIRRNGRERPWSAVDDAVFAQFSVEISKLDPGAELNLVMTCPGCGTEWQSPFDISSFLWIEIDALAKRLLREVSTLARAYGWRETEIIALSSTRRQAYLDLI